VTNLKINSEELKALKGERHILWALYIGQIRRYMDFKTGIAGITRKFDQYHLLESLEVEESSGRKREKISRTTLRNSLIRLEKKGLIRKIGKLIFLCPLAERDDQVQKRSVRAQTEVRQRSDRDDLRNSLNFNEEKSKKSEVRQRSDRAQSEVSATSGSISGVYPVIEKEKKNIKKEKRIYSDLGFLQFWAAYPSGAGKWETYQCWIKHKLSGELDEILSDIEWRKKNDDKWQSNHEGKTFILDPIRYCKRRRWDDEQKENIQDTTEARYQRYLAYTEKQEQQKQEIENASKLLPIG
jgi:hypothetical protein